MLYRVQQRTLYLGKRSVYLRAKGYVFPLLCCYVLCSFYSVTIDCRNCDCARRRKNGTSGVLTEDWGRSVPCLVGSFVGRDVALEIGGDVASEVRLLVECLLLSSSNMEFPQDKMEPHKERFWRERISASS